ncbi:hypothetical protein F3Y22_tig00111402pilonHSYRG00513 [Hibiscus syriacus]|uniref:NPH3 domain-containing protein n=1 Tax=Hibiscus syriacus TaxID=106335 RepID=A0A6A2XTG6_HIBSY|nr:hypothetical protein F3Y22_tig00111402pilonHSYRG00513 [Hibiscus syriacus]
MRKLKPNNDLTERRMSKSVSSTGLEVRVGSMPFALDKVRTSGLLGSKSAEVAALFKENSNADLSCLLRDTPADSETFELVARFCHGYAIQMSSENIVPLICLPFHLGIDENHCNDNLLSKAVTFFERGVRPCWNEIIKALRSSEKSLQQMVQLGLFDACLQAMVAKGSDNPQHLGERIIISRSDGDSGDKPNAKRRLFALDWQEDLTTLSLQLYEPIIYTMKQQYDIECIRRILKVLYGNYNSSDASGFITVAELMEEFLAEVACDVDLMIDTFISLAEMSMAAALGTKRNSDGIYRAIDIYLEKHAYLTEKEKEELQLRETLARVATYDDDKSGKEEEEEEDEARVEMEKMSIKVKELEKDCHEMKKEITNGSNRQRVNKGKLSLWSEMNRKFGCSNNMDVLHCPTKKKKVHPKWGII